MTAFELFPRPARAGIIPAHLFTLRSFNGGGRWCCDGQANFLLGGYANPKNRLGYQHINILQKAFEHLVTFILVFY